jgi:hypothetical protein
MTGFWVAAARKRSVLPTIHAVRTPPPEPPVTNRLPGSTWPVAIAASTALIRSS